jgi:hypothetical protein
MDTADDKCYNMLGGITKLVVAAEWQAMWCGDCF